MFGGGKSMGGGGMLRTVGRAVTRAGVTSLQEPITSSSAAASNSTSPSSPTTASRTTQNRLNSPNHRSLSAATSPFSSHNMPVSAAYGVPSWSSFGSEDYEWVSVEAGGGEDEKSYGFVVDEFVLGPVPSIDEVNNAVSALQQAFDPTSYSQFVRDKFASNLDKDAELDWIEPSIHISNSRMFQPYGCDRVYDAFHLLQTEPSIQKMVVSLSSDPAVWNAVLNNEVVRELKESFYTAEDNGSESSDETCDGSNPAMNIIRWLFDNTKARVIEVIDKITNIVNELFKPPDDERATTGSTTPGATDPFQEKLRTSFLLSIVVLLVVVVTRAGRASTVI